MSEKPLGNPAAVGLGAFGATTLLLQFHNFGWLSAGPVFWLAMFFGGLAQLVAGFQEFKTGNNFGFAAFTTYGAFWLALGGILKSGPTGLFAITNHDIGWFLIIFTLLTLIYFFGAMRQSTGLSIVFLTLFLGYVFLDIFFLGDVSAFKTIAAIDLTICALSAWYVMAHVALGGVGIKIGVGKPWTGNK
jgi:succinate-acetate transporter protein